jgi:peptidoglycan/LPS O-acetylase OafA/YrhL
MNSHFLLLVLFAFLVSLVFAVLLRDQPREQLRTGALMFVGFVAAAVVLGWLMYRCLWEPRAKGQVQGQGPRSGVKGEG